MQRDDLIRIRWQAGVSADDLAKDYAITRERVRQIIGPVGQTSEQKKEACEKARTKAMEWAAVQASIRPGHVKSPMWTARWYAECNWAFVAVMREHYRETRLVEVR